VHQILARRIAASYLRHRHYTGSGQFSTTWFQHLSLSIISEIDLRRQDREHTCIHNYVTGRLSLFSTITGNMVDTLPSQQSMGFCVDLALSCMLAFKIKSTHKVAKTFNLKMFSCLHSRQHWRFSLKSFVVQRALL